MTRHTIALALIFHLVNASAADQLQVCIDYHCEHEQTVRPENSDWSEILSPFATPASHAGQERQQIRESIALFERVVGQYTDTHKDQPKNLGEDEIGQLDCIAESVNTQHYLQWLASNGKLKWHRVDERVKRSPYFLDVHWGVKITELHTRKAYIVDSWYGANAEPPDIRPLSQWLNKQ